MRKWTATTIALVLAGGAAMAGAVPGRAEDDLAIVKKAVASPSPKSARESRPAAAGPKESPSVTATAASVPVPAAPEARSLPRAGREPRWFKVRVLDRATGRKKVTINLPLSLVRVLGDDTIDWGCRDRGEAPRCHSMRLSEVLRSLEAGQELVEIEDEEAAVKVWVE